MCVQVIFGTRMIRATPRVACGTKISPNVTRKPFRVALASVPHSLVRIVRSISHREFGFLFHGYGQGILHTNFY